MPFKNLSIKATTAALARAFNALIGGRIAAEAALRLQKAELEAANDASPLGVFRTDPAGQCTYVNPAGMRMVGLSYQECLGTGWRKGVHPDDWGRLKHELAATAGSTEQHQFSYRYRHRDGKVVEVLVNVAPIRVEGRFTGYISVVEDVTERRMNEAGRRMLLSIMEATADYIAATDLHGRVTYINPAGRRLRGIAPETDITRTTIQDHYPGWAVERIRNEAVPAAARRGVWIGETAVYDQDRNEVPLSHMVIAHRGNDGNVEYFSGIMRDMTAANHIRDELRQSEERLRLITDNVPALISYLDRETRFHFVNRAYETWFNTTAEAMYGLTLAEFYGTEVYATFRRHIEAALEGRTVSYERELAAAIGLRSVQVTLVPDLDASGRTHGLFAVMHDITALKQAERQLEKMARFDALTGLPNRNHFNESIRAAMALSRRDGGAMALMYLDLDKFKAINDTLGHGAGDQVLKEFGARLTATVRTTDTVARLGGDEFVIILRGLNAIDETHVVARKILAAAQAPMALGERTLHMSTSIGIAYLDGEAIDAETLIQRADLALYAAKARGRNTYHLAGREPAEAARP